MSGKSAEEICMSCGACCENFRVSFYWAEMIEKNIPTEMVEQMQPLRACMVGTNQSKPRCVALEGEVGKCVKCTIYPSRPSPCYDVNPGDEKCNTARQKHHLPVI